MKHLVLISIYFIISLVTNAQQVIKVNGKYGAIERDTTILNPIYDTVYQPDKDYSLYIFGKDGKYGYHITYGCDECYEKISLETSDLIFDSIYNNYKNYIFEKEGRFMFKSVMHIAEFDYPGWNRPVRYHLRHFDNPESQWYDSIIVDRKIQKIKNLEDVLLLKNNELYGLFTRYGGGENVHGTVTECLWDSIQPITTFPIFMAWKDGEMHYLNAATNKFTSESFKPGEIETYWDPMEVKQHGKPIRFFSQETMDEIYTIMDDNGPLVRDSLLNYYFENEELRFYNESGPERKDLRDFRMIITVSNNSSNDSTKIDPVNSLKYALDKNYNFYSALFVNDTTGENLISFNNENWVYFRGYIRDFNYNPILAYDLNSTDPNEVSVNVYSSRDGKLIKKFNRKDYFITIEDNEIRAVNIEKIEISNSMLWLGSYGYRNSKKIKKLGYYSYNKKKNEYEIVRFKWMVNEKDWIIQD